MDVPGTFVGPNGSIRYELIAKIKRPDKIDLVAKKYITVASVLDLNESSLDLTVGFNNA